MVERQATDLKVRVRVPVQVWIFLLIFNKINKNIFVGTKVLQLLEKGEEILARGSFF